MYRELLLGCGSNREKKLGLRGREDWHDVVTLDLNPAHKPDIVWDLEVTPWPFESNSADEIHAYDVIEHCSGQQGDAAAFFGFFAEVYRILKPNGVLLAIVPSYKSEWAFGDPSHKRVLTPGTLVFLSQPEYAKQVGRTPMSDFRFMWRGDFEPILQQLDDAQFRFVLEAKKPARH